MNVIELIDQRINAAACNGKTEVLASLVELKGAIGNMERERPLYLVLSEDRDAALGEVVRLRAQLAHEENFSASQLELRNQAEDERDELKVRLEQLQSSLTRPEPSRLEIAAMAMDGLLRGDERPWMRMMSDENIRSAMCRDAVQWADALIAEARKGVQ